MSFVELAESRSPKTGLSTVGEMLLALNMLPEARLAGQQVIPKIARYALLTVLAVEPVLVGASQMLGQECREHEYRL